MYVCICAMKYTAMVMYHYNIVLYTDQKYIVWYVFLTTCKHIFDKCIIIGCLYKHSDRYMNKKSKQSYSRYISSLLIHHSIHMMMNQYLFISYLDNIKYISVVEYILVFYSIIPQYQTLSHAPV